MITKEETDAKIIEIKLNGDLMPHEKQQQIDEALEAEVVSIIVENKKAVKQAMCFMAVLVIIVYGIKYLLPLLLL